MNLATSDLHQKGLFTLNKSEHFLFCLVFIKLILPTKFTAYEVTFTVFTSSVNKSENRCVVLSVSFFFRVQESPFSSINTEWNKP